MSNTEPTIRVPTLEKYQHYRDRSPPWIKLHRELFTDYDFACLQDASKMHLVSIWLLASQMDNVIPANAEWIAKRINATSPVDLKTLIHKGFLELASGVLAECKQSAMLETEGEAETETEKKRSPNGDLVAGRPATRLPKCPMEKIRALWEKHTGQRLTDPKTWHENRKVAVRRLWGNGRLGQDLDEWDACFGYVASSKFLRGENDRQWRADFDWILKPANLTKLEEGKYHGV